MTVTLVNSLNSSLTLENAVCMTVTVGKVPIHDCTTERFLCITFLFRKALCMTVTMRKGLFMTVTMGKSPIQDCDPEEEPIHECDFRRTL